MAFKLTYTDGQESDYDDDTKWELDDGVLKLGRGNGNWSVFVSPGHWATIELGKAEKKKDDKDEKADKDNKAEKDEDDKDEKADKDDKAEKDEDDKADKDEDDKADDDT
jgi:hypothetical protein